MNELIDAVITFQLMDRKSFINDIVAEIFCLCYKLYYGCILLQPKIYRLFRIKNRNLHLKSLPIERNSAIQDRHS